jgi:type I restriction enzyme M protein
VGDFVRDGMFDIVMTNPPFAGEITQAEVLGGYDLAYKGDPTQNKRANKVERDVLFIERCLRFLKPGGRMAIVLPQGIFNNTSDEYIRKYVMKHARILAVVGLQGNMFKPFTGTKTSVLCLQKWQDEAERMATGDYRIFFATNQKSGKDNSGEYIWLDKESHERVRNPTPTGLKATSPKSDWGSSDLGEAGRGFVLDHDLHEIMEAFKLFAGQENLSFFA